MYEKYNDLGLEILGFPCNQFLGQEPGTDEDIQACAKGQLKAKFPIFSKTDVNGSAVGEVFSWIKNELPGFLGTTSVKWNFTKFLVDRDGRGFKRYSPHTDPMSLAADIEELLSRECTDCMDGNSSKLLEQKVINVGEMGLSANALDDLEKATEQLVL